MYVIMSEVGMGAEAFEPGEAELDAIVGGM
jgi:hypothetical protein